MIEYPDAKPNHFQTKMNGIMLNHGKRNLKHSLAAPFCTSSHDSKKPPLHKSI